MLAHQAQEILPRGVAADVKVKGVSIAALLLTIGYFLPPGVIQLNQQVGSRIQAYFQAEASGGGVGVDRDGADTLRPWAVRALEGNFSWGGKKATVLVNESLHTL